MNSPVPSPLPDQGETHSPLQRPLGPGGRLARMRAQKGISLDDVAGVLKYTPRQLEALEADHYDMLPPATVVRGMVRGYAKFLGLEAEPILEELRLILTAPPPAVSAPVMDVPFLARRRTIHWVWWTVPALVALALIAFGFEYFMREGMLSRLHGLDVRSWLPGGAPHAGEAQSPAATSAAALPVSDAAMAGSPMPGGGIAGATIAAARPASTAGSTAGAPGRGPTRRIQIRCDNRAWVEVRSGDGQILVSQLLDAGTDRIIEGRPPFTVVIGAAHGVVLTYEGQPVNLTPYTAVDVARLSLN